MSSSCLSGTDQLQQLYLIWPSPSQIFLWRTPLFLCYRVCEAKITSGNARPNITVGCIYQHPTCNLPAFSSEFDTLLNEISQYEIYILGDFNIDLLKYSKHLLSEEYLDMLYSNNLLPLITKPTRLTHCTSTLIDHIIYTNSNLSVVAALCWLIPQTIYTSVLYTWSANIKV